MNNEDRGGGDYADSSTASPFSAPSTQWENNIMGGVDWKLIREWREKKAAEAGSSSRQEEYRLFLIDCYSDYNAELGPDEPLMTMAEMEELLQKEGSNDGE